MSSHKVVIDATDRKILKFLVKNARMPYLEIARECGISGAAIHQRIKKLEESGIIMGSRMVVNPKMLGFDEAETLIGHAVGGVCPFAVNEGVDVYLDESLKRFKTVFPACGSSNSAIELTIPELEELSGLVKWIDVCKLPENI